MTSLQDLLTYLQYVQNLNMQQYTITSKESVLRNKKEYKAATKTFLI